MAPLEGIAPTTLTFVASCSNLSELQRYMERVAGVEPVSSAWKAEALSHWTIPAWWQAMFIYCGACLLDGYLLDSVFHYQSFTEPILAFNRSNCGLVTKSAGTHGSIAGALCNASLTVALWLGKQYPLGLYDTRQSHCAGAGGGNRTRISTLARSRTNHCPTPAYLAPV